MMVSDRTLAILKEAEDADFRRAKAAEKADREMSVQLTGKPKTDAALVEEMIARVSEHIRAEPHEGTITITVAVSRA